MLRCQYQGVASLCLILIFLYLTTLHMIPYDIKFPSLTSITFAAAAVCKFVVHTELWTLRLQDTSLMGHFVYWTVHLLFGHFAFKARFKFWRTSCFTSYTFDVWRVKSIAWRPIKLPSAWNICWHYTLFLNVFNPGWNLMFYCKLYILACLITLNCTFNANGHLLVRPTCEPCPNILKYGNILKL